MRIVVSGASGLIGTALGTELRREGHEVVRLVRREPTGPDEAAWDPGAHRLDPAVVSGADAVVHLAGAPAAQRWSSRAKAAIMNSRVDGTTTIAAAMAAAEKPPPVLLCSSGVNYYGDTGDRIVTEEEPPGRGFLTDVCLAWEAATEPAADAGVRVVRMRTGLVLGPGGGVFGRLSLPFRFGLGGRMGSGRQYWPWVSLRDVVGAMRFLLTADGVAGPVNLTGPEPVTNAEFTAELGRLLHRPTVLAVPAFALRAVLDGFADEAVLTGTRAVPAALTSHGYAFTDPTVTAALKYALGDA